MKKLSIFLLIFMLCLYYVGCKSTNRYPEETALSGKEISDTGWKTIHNSEGIAKELWKMMQEENYQNNWQMWPGKSALYKGTVPHGVSLTTYVNSAAYETIINKKGSMPAGAVIIKENYKPDKTLGAITVMKKIEGFNPSENDWFWVKYGPDGVVMTMVKDGMEIHLAGTVPGCLNCHGTKRVNDFVFTGNLWD